MGVAVEDKWYPVKWEPLQGLDVQTEILATFVLELADLDPGLVTLQAHRAACRAMEALPR